MFFLEAGFFAVFLFLVFFILFFFFGFFLCVFFYAVGGFFGALHGGCGFFGCGFCLFFDGVGAGGACCQEKAADGGCAGLFQEGGEFFHGDGSFLTEWMDVFYRIYRMLFFCRGLRCVLGAKGEKAVLML